MSFKIQHQSLTEMYEDFLTVYNWLSSQVSLGSGNRIDNYKKIFGELFNINDGEERLSAYWKIKDQANTAFYEIQEVASLKKLLQIPNFEVPNETLIKLAKGTFSYTEEKDDSAHARNYLYELVVASIFAERNDVQIDLTQRTDILLNYRLYEFAIECKRVRSEGQIVSNVSKAAKQLKKRYESRKAGKSMRGLIFISLTPVINSNFMFAASATTNFIQQGITKQVNSLINKYVYKIRNIKELKEKRTVGIVFQVTIPFMVMVGEGIHRRSILIPLHNSEKLLNDFLQL